MHLTTDCTGFDKTSIEVLKKLNDNLLHICNDCKHKKGSFESATDAPESKLDSQLSQLQKQMKQLTEKMEESNDQIKVVQDEMKAIKQMTTTKEPNYKTALGPVKPGRIVTTVNSSPLGLIIRGLPEKETKSDKRMLEDLNYVEQILSHLEIEDQKLVKITRLGKYDLEKKKARPLLVRTDSEFTRDLIVKSAHNLKHFQIDDNKSPIYISPELNPEDSKKHRECLIRRRKLIDDKENDLTSYHIRIRNLKIQIRLNNKWTPIEKTDFAIESEKQNSESADH